MITVLCHGCFDILHYGHLLHLREARALGDRLVVSITGDEFFPAGKGPGRPVFAEGQRMAMLLGLRTVDEVRICYATTGAPSILHVRPDYYVKGTDYCYTNLNELERAACVRVGAKIVFTTAPKFSSSKLVEYFK